VRQHGQAWHILIQRASRGIPDTHSYLIPLNGPRIHRGCGQVFPERPLGGAFVDTSRAKRSKTAPQEALLATPLERNARKHAPRATFIDTYRAKRSKHAPEGPRRAKSSQRATRRPKSMPGGPRRPQSRPRGTRILNSIQGGLTRLKIQPWSRQEA